MSSPVLPTPRIAVSPALAHRVDRRLVAELARRVRRAAQRLGLDAASLRGLGLRIVDDREMAALHLQYMGEPGPTDVLSFKGDEFEHELGAGLGDLVLDWDAVERQARDRSSAALLDEATVLAVHGLAHLRGHDHRNRQEGRAMHALERRVLRALRVPDPPRPYAPRLHASEPGHE